MNRLSHKDILFGKRLKVRGRKFTRNTKQNFITIFGPADSIIDKESVDTQDHNYIRQTFPNHVPHYTPDCAFENAPRLICEPERNSDCPDYKGSDDKKHHHKGRGHTPDKYYDVNACEHCALSYIDSEHLPRLPGIALKSFQIAENNYQRI
ncbi:MAG: hypothetical protein V1735_04535 [Nanoarchaeota archaeon]